jgi:hypothetical protein
MFRLTLPHNLSPPLVAGAARDFTTPFTMLVSHLLTALWNPENSRLFSYLILI